MPVKYECPKCEKRFVDWGAEKLRFKCPTCIGEQLVRVGSLEDRPVRKPTLRKRAKAEKPKEEEAVLAGDVTDDEELVEEPEEEEVIIGVVPALGKDTDDFDDDVVVDDDDTEISDDGEGAPDLEFSDEEGVDLDEKL